MSPMRNGACFWCYGCPDVWGFRWLKRAHLKREDKKLVSSRR